jgi:hypothetical protein
MWDPVEAQLGRERPALSHEMPCPTVGTPRPPTCRALSRASANLRGYRTTGCSSARPGARAGARPDA